MNDPGAAASSVAPWRLLVDPPADAGWNMAVDEAILEGYQGAFPAPPPTLRLYGWRPAAVSLGRSQPSRGTHDALVLAAEGIDLVRRPTGGGAVLHESERTYAVVGRVNASPFAGGVIATYRMVAAALASGLASLGVDASPVEPRRGTARPSSAACFEHVGAWELTVGGQKLVGSAQARRRTAFLQHGSIPIRLDAARLAAVLGSVVNGSRFTDLERAAGRPVDPDALDRAVARGFQESFGVPLVAGQLSESEALRAAELRCWKYDSIAWTLEGRIGPREARWGPSVGR